MFFQGDTNSLTFKQINQQQICFALHTTPPGPYMYNSKWQYNINNQTWQDRFCLLSTLKSAGIIRPENERMSPKKEPFQEENHLPTSIFPEIWWFLGEYCKKDGTTQWKPYGFCNPIQGSLVFFPSKAHLIFGAEITNDMAVTLSEKGHLRLLYIYIYISISIMYYLIFKVIQV